VYLSIPQQFSALALPQKLLRWRNRLAASGPQGRKKPANLIYDVDEVPPVSVQLGAAFQHLFAVSVGWVYVLLAVNAIGGTSADTQNLIRMSMIASGVATIVQARKGIGNGYLCPLTCSLTYLAPIVLAGLTGAYSLIFGMLVVSGVCGMLVSRVVHRLRVLFPPEVTGLMVAMSGLQLVALGCPRFLGYSKATATVDARAVMIGVITLFSMIIPTIWTRSKLHLFPMLIGVASGYAAAVALGEFSSGQLLAQMPSGIVSFPHRAASGLSFQLALLPPFLIAVLTASLKTVGDTTLCQKANDAAWKRSDMTSVSGGVFSTGLGNAVSGFFGGIGQNTASSSIGISLAAGTTSRAIALPLGLIVIGLAFIPKAATIVAAMPGPAVGAVVIYSACFIILGGFQLLTSRMLDARRIFAVGISLIFGVSVEMVPDLYHSVPAVLKPIFSSSTSVATVLVVILSLLFRFGLKKQSTLELRAGADNLDQIAQFMDDQGSAWGMRKEVVDRATDAAHEVISNLGALPLRSPFITLRSSWDELMLDLEVEYDGMEIELSDSMPTVEQMATDAGVAQLAGYLIRQYADRVRIRSKNGQSKVQLHFEH
jgi:NCS2 family nucleobase:cation symporter-2